MDKDTLKAIEIIHNILVDVMGIHPSSYAKARMNNLFKIINDNKEE